MVANAFEFSFPKSQYIIGFYSTSSRAWEFSTGGIVYIFSLKKYVIQRKYTNILSSLGVILIITPIIVLDQFHTYPSFFTIAPILGASILLFVGSNETGQIQKFLSSKIMMKIGDWSYSIYLWHWPVIVICKYLFPGNRTVLVIGVILSFVPAYISFKYLETPLRKNNLGKRNRKRISIILVTVPLLATLVLGSFSHFATRHPEKFKDMLQPKYEVNLSWSQYYNLLKMKYSPCSDQVIEKNSDFAEGTRRCFQTKPSKKIDILLLGDSHAEALFIGIDQIRPELNVAYYIYPTLPISNNPNMRTIIERVSADTSIRQIIVNADWGQYGAPAEKLRSTLVKLSKSHSNIILLNDVPVFPFDANACNYGISIFIPIHKCSISTSSFRENSRTYAKSLQSAVLGIQGVTYLDTSQYFCSFGECSMVSNGKLLYRDSNHLNEIGSSYLLKLVNKGYPNLLVK
jgi:hypothetical protein